MKKTLGIIYLMMCLPYLLLPGCGDHSPESNSTSAVPPTNPPQSLKVINPQKVGSISGKIKFLGDPPKRQELPMGGNPECQTFHPSPALDESIIVKDGNLQNVFVYVKDGLEGYFFPIPSEPVKINQSKCLYVPHITGAQAGQKILLVNSDPTLHNVHSYSTQNESWNLGMPFEGMEIEREFKKPEVMVTMKCDLHPWMIGFIGILPHPYFSVSNGLGDFSITNLPEGEYTLEAWHEKLGTRIQKVSIKAGEKKELEFSFELPKHPS